MPLDPSHNPEECLQLCATMKTRKGEVRELTQGHVAGKKEVRGQSQDGHGRKRQEAQLQERKRCGRMAGAWTGQGDPGRICGKVRPSSPKNSVPLHMLFPLIHTSCPASFFLNSPFKTQLKGLQPSNAACPHGTCLCTGSSTTPWGPKPVT